jgi:hypothetical protein
MANNRATTPAPIDPYSKFKSIQPPIKELVFGEQNKKINNIIYGQVPQQIFYRPAIKKGAG